MSGKNKNYNSIIFLTTLSVYLGLSLLGATPQVLAYAATTRNFDIQTEIEFKDDLDNKPDNEFSVESPTEFNDFSRKSDYQLSEITRDFAGEVLLPQISDDCPLRNCGLIHYKFGNQKTSRNLSFDSSREAGNFPGLFRAEDSKFQNFESENNPTNYQSREISSENNRILTVANLPRAAIDSLIK